MEPIEHSHELVAKSTPFARPQYDGRNPQSNCFNTRCFSVILPLPFGNTCLRLRPLNASETADTVSHGQKSRASYAVCCREGRS
jgi:hypothetical protein